jgi:hypothetical protein
LSVPQYKVVLVEQLARLGDLDVAAAEVHAAAFEQAN